MNDQEKQAIQVLIQAADLACKRGAFNLGEAGQLAASVQIASSLLNSKKIEEESKKIEEEKTAG